MTVRLPDPTETSCEFCGVVSLDFGHAEPECGNKARTEARRLRQIVNNARVGNTGAPMLDFDAGLPPSNPQGSL